MLVAGVCNPAGEAESYNGLYLRGSELSEVARKMVGLPLLAEHAGKPIGHIVSAYVGSEDGTLNCVARIDDQSPYGSIVSELVRDNVARDFSLGYSVDVQHSVWEGTQEGRLVAGTKTVNEVSLVRKGARERCNLFAMQPNNEHMFIKAQHTGGGQEIKTGSSAEWASFCKDVHALA